MIKLRLPDPNLSYYVVEQEFLIGPIQPPNYSSDEIIESRAPYDKITQGRRLFDENDVDHIQAKGEVIYHPVAGDIQPIPSTNFPNNINVDLFNLYTGATDKLNAGKGLAVFGAPTFAKYSAFKLNSLFLGGPTSFTLINVFANDGQTTGIRDGYIYEYRFADYTDKSCNVYFTATYFTTGTIGLGSKENTYNWSTPQSTETITNLVKDVKRSTVVNSGLKYLRRSSKPVVAAPSKIVNALFLTADRLNEVDTNVFNHKQVHFGDLAKTAVDNVRDNSVNMIAFLKDLRRPTELIPKLRNLSKLKTHANNLLTVEYGILPTIGDISLIMDAFKKAAPYVDRHGFATYGASNVSRLSAGDYQSTLEQRIKVAIENEDNQFLSLMERIDNWGFAPSLENIWDLIPYSFVLDWFIDVGGFLERLDTRTRMSMYNIQFATMSTKRTTSVVIKPTAELPISGLVSLVRYSRWTSDQCPEPPLFSSGASNPLSHWLEGSALYVQRRK